MALFVGDRVQRLRPYFERVERWGQDKSIWLLRGRTQPWSEIWPEVQFGLSSN